jgi:phospholipase C
MSPLTRRELLVGAAAAGAVGAVGVAGCSSDSKHAAGSPAATTTATTLEGGLADPSKAPFDTVVVLMMENRSFDHLLGWLPGADGRQAGQTFIDITGAKHPSWDIGSDPQGCNYADPKHDWQAAAKQFNNGKADGFLRTQPVGDQFPISYYGSKDLPVLTTTARCWRRRGPTASTSTARPPMSTTPGCTRVRSARRACRRRTPSAPRTCSSRSGTASRRPG